jgi:hypothetical protein
LIPSICRSRPVDPESLFDPSGPDGAQCFAGRLMRHGEHHQAPDNGQQHPRMLQTSPVRSVEGCQYLSIPKHVFTSNPVFVTITVVSLQRKGSP